MPNPLHALRVALIRLRATLFRRSDNDAMQAETDEELEGIHANLQVADSTIVAEKGVHCCYAKSDKYWVTDPQGVAWESFRSLGSVPLYGEEHDVAPAACGSTEANHGRTHAA